MKKDNLQPKLITEFTPEDTIYISRKTGRDNSQYFLCQFIEYKGMKVYGKAISTDVNPKIYSNEIEDGLIVSARIQNCGLYGENPVSGRSHFHQFKSSGYAIYPYEYTKERSSADIIEKHPSFGMIGISRRSNSGGVPLFGSSIQHKETITLTICEGDVKRDLNREWYHARKQFIEIEMSATQFVEFIMTPNRGSGVPCTIKQIGLDSIPTPPFESRKDMFTQEFKNKMKNISTSLDGQEEVLNAILDKKSIGKADKEIIAGIFSQYKSDLTSNLPFMASSFVEQMDQTVLEAKGEVESFISRRLTEEGRKVMLGENGENQLITE